MELSFSLWQCLVLYEIPIAFQRAVLINFSCSFPLIFHQEEIKLTNKTPPVYFSWAELWNVVWNCFAWRYANTVQRFSRISSKDFFHCTHCNSSSQGYLWRSLLFEEQSWSNKKPLQFQNVCKTSVKTLTIINRSSLKCLKTNNWNLKSKGKLSKLRKLLHLMTNIFLVLKCHFLLDISHYHFIISSRNAQN